MKCKCQRVNLERKTTAIFFSFYFVLLCQKGARVLQTNTSRWISYCHNSHPFYYLLPSHTNKPLSPDTELLSCFSKPIHPLPALHFQPAASPPPSSLFSSSARCSRRLVSIKCYPSSRLSCGMSFSQNQIQGNPLPWSINHLSVYTLLSLHEEN